MNEHTHTRVSTTGNTPNYQSLSVKGARLIIQPYTPDNPTGLATKSSAVACGLGTSNQVLKGQSSAQLIVTVLLTHLISHRLDAIANPASFATVKGEQKDIMHRLLVCQAMTCFLLVLVMIETPMITVTIMILSSVVVTVANLMILTIMVLTG